MPYNAAMKAGNVALWNNRQPHIKNGTATAFFPMIWSAGSKPLSGSQGATMTCSSGQWVGPNLTFSRQWARDALTISGATNASYVLVSTDSGKTVACTVIATNKYGAAYLVTSLPVLA